MADYFELDVDSIAHIGLMFLDGDSLEELLLDKYGHTDYDFDKFNDCKIALMKIEKINPNKKVTAILWQARPINFETAVPVVAGKALPIEGYGPIKIHTSLQDAFDGKFGVVLHRVTGEVSHYYPVKNSDAEIVGALELLCGASKQNDI